MTNFEPVRSTENLELTTHALDMVKTRDIPIESIKEAIEDGTVEEAKGENNVMYRLDMPVDLLVVVDLEQMNIVSTYYDDEQGASEGSIRQFEL